MDFKQIISHNQAWIQSKLSQDPDYFNKLASEQKPEALYIGCSDSRVTAEEIIGAKPGELFVHRNIANTIIGTDLNAMSVIEYAVVHLKVNHIVICGHYGCGGVKAAMQSEDLGILNPWLRNIRDVYRLHTSELSSIADEPTLHKRLVELNVQEQCVNLLKVACVQKAVRERELKVYGWVFDLHTGKIIDLKINFEKVLDGIRELYHLD